MPRDGAATRSRILSTALRLFVERGYDKTSLREIADEVGVTKAALYYHFRTKDDIARTAIGQFGGGFTEVVAWLESRPAGPERDAEFVDRVLDLMESGGMAVIRLAQSSPTVMAREHDVLSPDVVQRLLTALTGEHPTAEATMRSILSFVTLMIASIGTEGIGLPLAGTPAERRGAARAIALDLLAAARA